MDKHKSFVIEKRIMETIKALEKNNINGYFVKDKAELLEHLEELMPAGASISHGGSVTLEELGICEWLKGGKYKYLDRSAPGFTPEDAERVQREAFFADFYITSSNAVTMQGELYNVDGRGNRVAAIAYGPKKVIFVVGYNKITDDMASAVHRVANIAAPANVQRIAHKKTGCAKKGQCTDCHTDDRICCQYIRTAFHRDKEKYHVFFLPIELGY